MAVFQMWNDKKNEIMRKKKIYIDISSQSLKNKGRAKLCSLSSVTDVHVSLKLSEKST